MDIRSALEREHSKVLSERIATYVSDDAGRFAELMRCVLDDDDRIASRAAWAMGMACKTYPDLAEPWLGKMLQRLDEPVHEAVHRNIFRTLQCCPLPKRFHGRITQVSFAWLADPARPIAARAFAITVALRMVEEHPALTEEFCLLVEEALRVNAPPAIRSRGGKAIQRLRKLRGEGRRLP